MLKAISILCLLLLGGCDAVLSVARTAGQAGLDHTLRGYVHRTVTEPMGRVRLATGRALDHMAIKVDKSWMKNDGWHAKGEARNRTIEVWLEPLSKQATMVRVVVNKNFIAKDSATATEIIEQVVHSLDVFKAQALLARLGYEPGSVDGVLGPRTRDAIITFQNRNRLLRDGEVTSELLSALEQNEARRDR